MQPWYQSDAQKIVRTLRDYPFAKVKFPDREKMREYAAMVEVREPIVNDIIGFMDSVSFSTECTWMNVLSRT